MFKMSISGDFEVESFGEFCRFWKVHVNENWSQPDTTNWHPSPPRAATPNGQIRSETHIEGPNHALHASKWSQCERKMGLGFSSSELLRPNPLKRDVHRPPSTEFEVATPLHQLARNSVMLQRALLPFRSGLWIMRTRMICVAHSLVDSLCHASHMSPALTCTGRHTQNLGSNPPPSSPSKSPLAPNMFGSPVGKDEGQPPPPPQTPPPKGMH